MRKLLLIVFILIYTSAHTQNFIDGLGKFKIGMAGSDIEKYIIDNGYTYYNNITSSSEVVALLKNEKTVGKIPYTGESIIYGDMCEKTVVFIFSNLIIADINIKKVQLYVYKGKLIRIAADSSTELFNALSLKYGKPKVEKKKEYTTCVNVYTGYESELVTTTFKSQWENKKNDITCTDFFIKGYNDNCEEDIFLTIMIYDNKLFEESINCRIDRTNKKYEYKNEKLNEL